MKHLHIQFVLAFFAGWVSRGQRVLIEYLKTENEIYREKLGSKRIRITNGRSRLNGFLNTLTPFFVAIFIHRGFDHPAAARVVVKEFSFGRTCWQRRA
jgi:hypothetical protein